MAPFSLNGYMQCLKKIVSFIFFCLACVATEAKHYVSFDHYSTLDGLSCNFVTAIGQDNEGFLWVGTGFGLNRFDGSKFKIYSTYSDSSLLRSDITALNLFPKGDLFVSCPFGVLQSYDEPADTFVDRRFPELTGQGHVRMIIGFQQLRDSMVYMMTTGGVFRYDLAGNLHSSPICDSTKKYFVEAFFLDGQGRYWVGTFDGLHIFDAKGNPLHTIHLSSERVAISSILEVEKNRLLVASKEGDLWHIELKDDGSIAEPVRIKVEFKSITKMLKDRSGMVWIGTLGHGLWQMDRWLHFEKIVPPYEQDGLQQVHAIFEDKVGNVWIGTQHSGLWRYRDNRGEGILHSSLLGFPNVNVSSFIETREGGLYVGTDGHGLYRLSENLVTERHWLRSDGLPSNSILSFSRNKDGNILFSSWAGNLASLNPDTDRFSIISYNGIRKPGNNSKSVRVMRDGEIWVTVLGDGIYRSKGFGMWERVDFWFSKDVRDAWIDGMDETKDGVKWVVAGHHIWRYDHGDFDSLFVEESPDEADPNYFYDGVCDSEGGYYVVSNKAVFYCSPDGKSIEMVDYLPKGRYSAAFFSSDGSLWLTGSVGILCADVEARTYRSIPLEAGRYGSYYFLSRAIYQDADGCLFFGCSDGFVFFNPTKMRKEFPVERLAWDNLSTDERHLHIEDDHVTLEYGESQVRFSFDLLNFSGVNDLVCQYRIVGLDDRWYNLDKREVQFDYIPAGDYRLEVAAYHAGYESDKRIISLTVKVLPPWWKTLWFRLLQVLGVLTLFGAVFYARMKVMQRRQRYLEEVVDNRTADLLQALKDKDRLVSIVAHDLKNPMFSIVCGLQMLEDKAGHSMAEESRTILKTVHQSSVNLQKELVQLLDWTSSRQNEAVCQPCDVDLASLVEDVKALLCGLCEDKNLSVIVKSDLGHYAFVDPRMIGSVIRNLMNNAIKFTPKQGTITINLFEEGGKAKVEVIDSGVGMDEQQVSALMRGGSQSTRGTDNELGTGLGFRICAEFVAKNGGTINIESKVGEGTCISLLLPLSEHIWEPQTELPTSADTKEEEVEHAKVDASEYADLLSGNVVLVVDDDPMLRMSIRELLSPYMTVLEAEDGAKGLELATLHIPDMILSDVEMPGMDGLEMLSKIHEQKSTVHIPTLILSAKNSDEERIDGLAIGAIDYISKPFSEGELLLKIKNILLWRRKQQQRFLTGDSAREGVEATIDPLLKSVLTIIEEHYTDSEFSVEDMSKMLSISKSTLIRKLKSITDKTPIEILGEFRLNKADALLRKQGLAVKEVAFQVGFNDQYYFSRKYKEYFGYPPSKV